MQTNYAATVTKEEFERYVADGQKLLAKYPDTGVKLNQLAERMDMHPVVAPTIIKRKRPDVQVWLGTKEGEEDARRLHNVAHSEYRSLEELNKIITRLDRNKPFADHESPISPTDRYLRQIREDIRAGKRRR